jgi:hypothetical protein
VIVDAEVAFVAPSIGVEHNSSQPHHSITMSTHHQTATNHLYHNTIHTSTTSPVHRHHSRTGSSITP